MPSQGTRVLFWADDFGPGAGGAEVWSLRYVTAMQQRGLHIEVLAADGVERDASRSTAGDVIPVHRIPVGEAMRRGNPRAFHACLSQISALRERFQPDLLHLSIGMSAPSLSLYLMAGRSVRGHTPAHATIGTLHCAWPESFVHPGCLLERTLKQVNWLAGDSQDMRRWADAHWPGAAARFAVIPQALPCSGISEYPLPTRTATRTIAFIGRLSKEKGPDLALRAFSLLRRSFADLRMTFAGDGQERASLMALAAELGVSEDVTFRGWLDEQQVRTLMRSCELILMPSRQEGFGLVALEAAREGRPIVATAVGGIPEVCLDGETALLCPPGDPEALSAACARLIADPCLAERMGRAALTHFRRFPSWHAHLDAYEALMDRALATRNRPASESAVQVER